MSPGESTPTRPFPAVTNEEYRQHFLGLEQNQLWVRKCLSCGTLQWPPRPVCGACFGGRFEPRQVAKEGIVYSFIVCHRAFDPWFSRQIPFGVVIAEIEPGVRIVGNTFGSDVERLSCDRPVDARFRRPDDDVRIALEWVPR